MITLLRSPLMPLPSKGRPALWLVVSLVFAVSLAFAGLLFAASARAQEANAPESTTEAPTGEAAPESGVPPAQTTTPSAGEQVAPTGEQAPSATEQPQASDEHEQSPSATEESATPAEQTPPVAEDPPPTSEPTPPAPEDPSPTNEPTPPAPEDPPTTNEPTPPAPENPPTTTPPVSEQSSPTGGKTPPAAEEAPAHEPQTTEKSGGKADGETGSEGLTTEGTGDPQTPADASGSDHKEPANEVVPASSPVATASGTDVAMPVVSMPAGESQTPGTLESLTSSARRQARQGELAAFEASTIAADSIGRWLDTPGVSSVSTIALVAIDASPVAMIATGALARDRDSGSALESHTSGSGPSPAPGGAGGGSAAGAGSGAASSASSILMDALPPAAPNAMLRLYVSQPSWHTSFFALFPERPG
jgi:hypothetical protein